LRSQSMPFQNNSNIDYAIPVEQASQPAEEMPYFVIPSYEAYPIALARLAHS